MYGQTEGDASIDTMYLEFGSGVYLSIMVTTVVGRRRVMNPGFTRLPYAGSTCFRFSWSTSIHQNIVTVIVPVVTQPY